MSSVNINSNDDLMQAVKFGNIAEVLKLRANRVDPNILNDFGLTALMLACTYRHLEIVNALLALFRADPNIPNTFGETVLMYAAKYGDLDIVYALLLHGANIFITNRENHTPFDIAVKYGRIKTARVLRMAMLWSRFRSYSREIGLAKVLEVRYAPGGPVYNKALKHFENARQSRFPRSSSLLR